MTREEESRLAEQLLINPLFETLLGRIEASAIEALIVAKTEQDRVEAQWRVRSARSFREDCMAAVGSNRPRKAAPA